MKRKLLFISVLLFSTTRLFAQGPTFTSSFNPYAGFTATLQQELETGTADGATGASVTWDYSALQDTAGSPQSVSFIEPDATSYSSYFQTATLASGGGGSYNYYETNSSYYANLGLGTSSFIDLYTTPEMEWQYPFSYGTLQTSTYGGSYSSGGFTYTTTGTDTLNADGYGTLTIKSHTYHNALRFIVNQDTHTDINGSGGSGTSDIDVTSIYYAVPSYQYPLLLVQRILELQNGTYYTSWRAVAYTSSAPTGINDINPLVNNLNVFPNPSYSQSTLYLTLEKASTINVYVTNIIGQKIKNIATEQDDAGQHNYFIETGDMAKGIYLVNIEVNGAIAGVSKLEVE